MKRHDLAMYISTGVSSLVIGGLLLRIIYGNLFFPALPDFLQTAIQSAIFLGASAFLVMIASNIVLFYFNGKIRKQSMSERGYILEYPKRNRKYAVCVSIIFIAFSFILGGATEALYWWGTDSLQNYKERAGSYIVADFSTSMTGNIDMKTALGDYIRDIDNAELFSITLYSDEVIIPERPNDMDSYSYEQALKIFNSYTYFESAEQKENVIKLIESTDFFGETNTNDALNTALRRIRNSVTNSGYERLKNKKYYPCEIYLFSDGMPTKPIDYNLISKLSIENSKTIPISTIFYGNENAEGSETMKKIAYITGGSFNYATPSKLKTIFIDVSNDFRFNNPNILYTVMGPLSGDIIRIMFQWLLIVTWILASTFAVYILIGSKSNLKSFVKWKIIWSVILCFCAVILIDAGYSILQTLGQFLIAISFAVMFPIKNKELRGE